MLRRLVLVALGLVACGCSDTGADFPPDARAGTDVAVWTGDSVTLDGSASTDPEEKDLTFSWSLLSAPAGSTLVPGEVGTNAEHTFQADAAGRFVFALVVDDGKNSSAPDVVAVDARDPLAVAAIVPEDGSDGVAGRAPVVVLFSAPLRPASAPDALVVEDVTDPGSPVEALGTLQLEDGDTALVFSPVEDWEDLREYRVTVRTAATGLDGAPLRADVSATFTGAATDTVPPRVLAVSPANDPPGAPDTARPRASVVTWLLSEPLAPATASSAATLSGNGSPVEGYTELSAGGVRLTFVPADVGQSPEDPEELAPNGEHTAVLSAIATDLSGNALDGNADGIEGDDFESRFLTATGTDTEPPRILYVSPIRGANGVGVKLPVYVTFSEPVEPSSVQAAFTLDSAGGASVPGTISTTLGNRVAIFTPAENLATASRFDLEIAGSVVDLAGNALDGDGDGAAGGAYRSFFRTGALAPPSVDSAAPDFAPIDSTVTIDVLGEDFLPGATVAVPGGGILVDDVFFFSSSQLQVTLTLSPAAAIGPRSLVVINPDGQQGAGLNIFDVLQRPPTVSSVFPEFASQGEQDVVLTVTGAHFQTGANVSFGDALVAVESVQIVSDDELQVTVDIAPSATVGFRNVRVTNPDAQEDELVQGFRVRLPLVTGASPSPEQGQTLDVTVTGNHLSPTPDVFTDVPGATVNSVTFISDTQLTVNLTVPGTASPGVYSLTVVNPDNSQGTAPVLTVVTAPPPTVTSASPTRAAQGETLNVTITGTKFHPGADVTFSGSGISVNSTTFTSESSLVANITIAGGASISARDVTVTNDFGDDPDGTASALFSVTGAAPTVTTVTPSSGAQGANLVGVQVAGTNIRANATVSFANDPDLTISNVVVDTGSQVITCDVQIGNFAPVGFRDVTITNTDNSSGTKASGFEVTSAGGGPSIGAVTRAPVSGRRLDSANSLRQGESNVRFAILGSNFESGATVSISGSGITVASTTFKSANRIDVELTAACGDQIPGARDVTVRNPLPPTGDGLTGTLVGGLVLRNGVVINEVATQERSNHGFGGLLNPSFEVVELYNGSSCTFDITNWRLDFVDAGGVTGYEVGSGTELYSGGTRAAFSPGAYALIQQPDAGGNNLADDVFIALFTVAGRYIDDVEIGDNEENDSANDGAPADGNDGANSGAADEMVGRCPNGSDSDVDIADFYQNELPGTQMAASDRASNNSECPPCANGTDDDLDGWIDMLDGGCTDPHTDGSEAGDPAAQCNDGMNNDGDGLIDEDDPDCLSGSDNNEAI